MSGATQNKQIIIQELPKGELTQAHFAENIAAVPEPADGEIVLRNILISIDAANRAWMQGATYREAVKAGDVMHGYAIAEIVASKSDRFKPGGLVASETRWAEYVAVNARKAIKVPAIKPLSNLLSVQGIAGKTAYHGLIDVGQPKAGETLVVSAAAGSVGGYVGQIGKALGMKVVGVAGGAEKCGWVVDEMGFDACVDYRDPGFFKALRAACPDGIDVYFDNVGGKVLESVLFLMNMKGRIACCGAVSQYDSTAPSGPRNVPGLIVTKRLRMEGFIVMDFADQAEKASADLAGWVQSGKIKVVEDIVDGIENAPGALIGLLKGENRGKRMVRVAPDPA